MAAGWGRLVTLERWGLQAEPLGGKTLWQEWAAGVEVNTQTEGGFRFFQSGLNEDDFIVGYFSSFPEIVA